MYVLHGLPYAYNALEPYYDEETLHIHHSIHHKSYVDGLNNAANKLTEARKKGDFTLIKHWERELAFNGSGHILHSLFWENMTPDALDKPLDASSEQIEVDLGGFECFKKQFSTAAITVEGSGWVVLGWSPFLKKLKIIQIEKHQNHTLMGIIPLLVLDVWEHAYYLKYQNKRVDFINNWWNIVNWEMVNERFLAAK